MLGFLLLFVLFLSDELYGCVDHGFINEDGLIMAATNRRQKAAAS